MDRMIGLTSENIEGVVNQFIEKFHSMYDGDRPTISLYTWFMASRVFWITLKVEYRGGYFVSANPVPLESAKPHSVDELWKFLYQEANILMDKAWCFDVDNVFGDCGVQKWNFPKNMTRWRWIDERC